MRDFAFLEESEVAAGIRSASVAKMLGAMSRAYCLIIQSPFLAESRYLNLYIFYF